MRNGMSQKTALPNSKFKFNSSVIFVFPRFICIIKITNLFEHDVLNVLNCLWEKQPPRTYPAICSSELIANFLNTWLCRKHDSWKTLLKEILFVTLREKCPNTEFFQVRIFLHSVRIQENTEQKNLRIWTLFTHVTLLA